MGTWRVRSEPASGRQGHRELLPRHRTQPRESSTAAALHGALVKLNTVLQSLSLLRTPSWGLLEGPPSNWRALTIPDDLVLPRACRRQRHLLGRPRFWAESGCSQFPVGGSGTFLRSEPSTGAGLSGYTSAWRPGCWCWASLLRCFPLRAPPSWAVTLFLN